MIKVTGNEGLTVFYECDCGVSGRCMIKPLSENGIIITDIRCPICLEGERIKMAQKDSSDELSWGCVIYNEITDYEIKEDLDD